MITKYFFNWLLDFKYQSTTRYFAEECINEHITLMLQLVNVGPILISIYSCQINVAE